MTTTQDIAAAVAEYLNDHAIATTLGFTAEMRFVPTFSRDEDMDSLRVTVVPVDVEETIENRSQQRYVHSVSVAVQIGLTASGEDEDDEIAANLANAQSIAAALRRADIDLDGVSWVSQKHDPLVIAEHVSQLRQFSSIISVHFMEVA